MKILITIIATTAMVLFAIQNFDHVPLYLFTGKAVQIRLIFVIAISGIAGYLIRYMISIHREDELKKKYRLLRLREKKKKYQARGENDIDYDDLY